MSYDLQQKSGWNYKKDPTRQQVDRIIDKIKIRSSKQFSEVADKELCDEK